VSAIVQGLLTGPLTRLWGEVRIVKAALICSAIGFVLMLLAQDILALVPTMGFFVLTNSMLSPSVSSLISQRASIKQGMAMGLNNSFQSLGRMTGPLWAGFIFDVNLRLPYLTGAFVMLFGFLFALSALKQTSAARQPVDQFIPPPG
jgi:DHA1 family multidrug resistance protein-like MFS transporter